MKIKLYKILCLICILCNIHITGYSQSAPAKPGPISGPSPICYDTYNEYSISPVPGATSYLWTDFSGYEYSGGTTFVPDAMVDYGNHTISVKAVNAYGASEASTKDVDIINIPFFSFKSSQTTFCDGATVTFELNSTFPPGLVYGYEWTYPYPGGTPTIAYDPRNTLTLNQSGTIKVEAFNMCGDWTVTKNITVVSGTDLGNVTPVIQGSSVIYFCPGSTVQLTVNAVSGASSYSWYKDGTLVQNSSSRTLTVTSAGNYYVKAKNSCSESRSSASKSVQSGLPTPGSISSNHPGGPICYDTPITFSIAAVPGATGYVWSGLSGQPNGTSFYADMMDSEGSHTLSVRAVNSCSQSAASSTTVTIEPRVTPVSFNLAPNNEYCQGQTANISINGGNNAINYTWKFNGSYIPNTDYSRSISMTMTQGGLLEVSANGYCNDAVAQATISVANSIQNSTPVISGGTGTIIVCPGQTTQLTVNALTGASYYIWYKNGTQVQSSTSRTLTVSSEGNYSVKGANVCGASQSSASKNVLYHLPAPGSISRILDPGEDVYICYDYPAYYKINPVPGATGYIWTDLDGQQKSGGTTFTANTMVSEGPHTLSVRAVNSCLQSAASSTTVFIERRVTPIYFSPAPEDEYCQGETETFSVAGGGIGVVSYEWKFNGSYIPNPDFNSISMELVQSGLLKAYAHGYCNSDSATATISVTNDVGIQNRTPVISGGTGPIVLCPGQTTQLTVNALTGASYYIWYKDGTEIQRGTSRTVTVNSEGNYSVKGANACGESKSASRNVLDHLPAPGNISRIMYSGEDEYICYDYPARFRINPVPGATGYLWTDLDGFEKDGADSIYANTMVSEGNHTLKVIAYNSCYTSDTSSTTVTIQPRVTSINFSPVPNAEYCQGDTATFSIAGGGNSVVSHTWKFNGSPIPYAPEFCTSLSMEMTESGVLEVSANGYCNTTTASATISVTNGEGIQTRTPAFSEGSGIVVLCPEEIKQLTVNVLTGASFYIWYKDGTEIQRGTSRTLNISSEGVYSVKGANACGVSKSSASKNVLYHLPAPGNISRIMYSGEDGYICYDYPARFRIDPIPGATGYIWTDLDGFEKDGADSIYANTMVSEGNHTLKVIAYNSCYTSDTSSTTVTIQPRVTPIYFSPAPEDEYCQGQTATFSTAGGGIGVVAYGWKFNGSYIPDPEFNSISMEMTESGLLEVYAHGYCNSDSVSAFIIVIDSSESRCKPPVSTIIEYTSTHTNSVTPSGAATYSIPIEVPPGTAGIQPSLSVTYNSQAKNGILGMGFGLAGLSSITRSGSTIYNDGSARGVNYDEKDNFALDGNRLIYFSGSGGSKQYRTEIETYSVIQAYDSNSDGIPDYFRVYTKTGRVLEYGNATNSKFTAGTITVAWYLNKVTDANGNYIEYIYGTHTSGEIFIDKIKYTGMEGSVPYNEIRFNYGTRTVDVTTTYIKGNLVTKSLLLENISTYCEDQFVKGYTFKYQTSSGDIYSYLSEVELQNENGMIINKTAFNWNKNNYSDECTYVNGLNYSNPVGGHSRDKHLFSCDINGDGITDIVKTFTEDNITYAEKYESQVNSAINGSPVFSHTGDKFLGENIVVDKSYCQYGGLIAGDFSGDGATDIMYVEDVNVLIVKQLRFRRFRDGALLLTADYTSKPPIYSTGDFNGDGLSDIFYIYKEKESSKNKIGLKIVGEAGTKTIYISPHYGTTELSNVLTLDFNSDGLTDILVFEETGYNVFYNKGENNPAQNYFNEFPDEYGLQIYSKKYGDGYPKFYPGDYNGDGLIDLLCYQETGTDTYKWVLAINKQNGFIFSDLSCFSGIYDDQDTGKDDERDYCYVLDINKDSKQDVIVYDAKYSWSSTGTYKNFNKILKYTFISTGNDFVQSGSPEENSTDEHGGLAFLKTTGDFNGDGSTDFLYYNNEISEYYCKNSFNTKGQHLLSKIIDGMNNVISIDYERTTSGSPVYLKTSLNVNFPYKKAGIPLTVVKSIVTPDGDTTTYSYKDATVHLTGKGFLGFREFSVKDDATNITTTTVFKHSFNAGANNYCLVMPDNVVTKLGTSEISKVYNYYSIGEIDASKKRIFPYINKTISYNELEKSRVQKDLVYDAVNGNITSDTSTYYNGTTYIAKTVKTYSNYADRISFAGDLNGYENGPGYVYIKKYHKDDTSGNSYERIKYEYYANGKIKTYTTNDDLPGKCSTKYVYNTNGTLQRETLSSLGLPDHTKSYTYDEKYRFIKHESDALGNFTETIYNYSTGDIISGTDIYGNKITYTYDRFGMPAEVISPTGVTTKSTTGWYSGSIANAYYYTADYIDDVIQGYTYYDKLGRAILSKTRNIDGTFVNIEKKYNSKGQLINESMPYFTSAENYTEYTYDAYGRIDTIKKYGELFHKYAYFVQDNKGYTTRITQENVSPEQYSEKTVDATGNIISAKDNGGEITYKYHKSWQVRKIDAPGSSITITYDDYDMQHTLNDPDAGTITYAYNAYGELSTQIDHKNVVTYMLYDTLGRITDKTIIGEGTTHYEYYTSGNGNTKLKKVTAPNNMYDSYEYDKYGNVISKTSFIEDGKEFTTSYQYDNMGRVVKETYPSGFGINNTYNGYGYLTEVNRDDNGTIIWQAGTMDEYGRWKDYTLGNNLLKTEKSYSDTYNMLETLKTKKISTGTYIQDLEYSFDYKTGNLTRRQDNMHTVSGNPLLEEFEYDALNRLNHWKINDATTWEYVNYDTDISGNITSKSTVADSFKYEGTRPHAVTGLRDIQPGVHNNNQFISYTGFNKVKTIVNDYATSKDSLTFEYGPMNNRKKVVYIASSVQDIKYYHNNFEEEVDGTNGTVKRQIHYIPGGDGIAAICVKQGGNTDIYYVLTDYLGSLHVIADADGNMQEELSFDAWGRRRNPNNWSYDNIPANYITSRGFTGHEHLDTFNLINMNGRVYDPYLGMFLSPDNFVQMPDFTQNFNRYGYCLNNPLLYTDHNGYWFGIDDAIAAGLGFVVGYVSYGVATGNFGWKAVAAGGVGAVVTWVGWNTMGAGTTALASTGGAGSATSFSTGMTAVFGSASGNFGVQFASLTFMNTMMNQDNLNTADEKGWDGIWAFGAYSASAVLSTSLNPSSITKAEGFRAWAGTVITDNISDNMEDGKFSSSRYHIGFLGYDFDKKEGYSIFSKGLDKGQRFDMAFETVLGLSTTKSDIIVDYRLPDKHHCDTWTWAKSMEQRLVINTAQIGYYSRRGIELWNSYYLITEQQTIYQHWYNQHYNDDGTAIY